MREELIGQHHIRFEPPDVLFVTNNGNLSVEDASGLVGRFEGFAEGKTRVLLLFNVERAGNMAPEARKIVVNALGRIPIGGIAIFGATFTSRVVSTLIVKAVEIIYPSAPAIHFFPSEAGARAWLNERREVVGGSAA
jgi:hypothetical protein